MLVSSCGFFENRNESTELIPISTSQVLRFENVSEPSKVGENLIVNSTFFIKDGKEGWAIGKDGDDLTDLEIDKQLILHFTEIGGWEKFNIRGLPLDSFLNAIWLNSQGTDGWMVGDAEISYVVNIWMNTAGTSGWVTDEDGTIYYYDGSKWKMSEQETSAEALFSISMQNDAKNGWAVGMVSDANFNELGSFFDLTSLKDGLIVIRV